MDEWMEEVCERKCVCLLVFFFFFFIFSEFGLFSVKSSKLLVGFCCCSWRHCTRTFFFHSLSLSFSQFLFRFGLPFAHLFFIRTLTPFNAPALAFVRSLTVSAFIPLKWKIYRMLLLHRFHLFQNIHIMPWYEFQYAAYNFVWFCDSIQSSKVPVGFALLLFLFHSTNLSHTVFCLLTHSHFVLFHKHLIDMMCALMDNMMMPTITREQRLYKILMCIFCIFRLCQGFTILCSVLFCFTLVRAWALLYYNVYTHI